MKWTAWIAVSAITLSLAPADGMAAPRKTVSEKSPDVLQPQQRKKAAEPLVSALLGSTALTEAAPPSVDDVGDADSFGRHVTYLGMTQTLGVVVQADCTGSDPTLERCIVANAAPAPTTFNESGLATINLPAKASKSLLCFTLTPLASIGWQNPLGTPANARFSANAVITIDNDVLDDPALIDPNTGLPFGGTLTVGLSTFSDMHTLQPGEMDNKTLFMTRSCIAGIVNKRGLMEGYGFTEAQAKEFFKKPMTLSFGARGTVALADFLSYFYGFRLYGD
jgi:hypothetical protein